MEGFDHKEELHQRRGIEWSVAVIISPDDVRGLRQINHAEGQVVRREFWKFLETRLRHSREFGAEFSLDRDCLKFPKVAAGDSRTEKKKGN